MDDTRSTIADTVFSRADASRVPYRLYRDPEIYARELERIFYGPTWNYVGLECEVPNPGDYRLNHIGAREVILLRKEDGGLNVLENRCAHRGAQVCYKRAGNCGRSLMCPYHQWTYDLDGTLTGVTFRRGVKGQGGMPKDFDMKAHRMRRLRAESLNGIVFASFDESAPSLRDYLGPDTLHYVTRVFDGRQIRVLGYQRQLVDSNWKLVVENFRDPYHAGILHHFLVAFGLFRLDQKSEVLLDDSKAHGLILSRRGTERGAEDVSDIKFAAADFRLSDQRLLDPVMEYADDATSTIHSLFPAIVIQAQSNTLALRHVIPKGPVKTELAWTFFGYADDDAAMTSRRLLQANLMGAAGYVTVDDAEVIEFSQIGLAGAPETEAAVLELGGRDAASEKHMVTESLIRGFYQRWRKLMDL